MGDIYICSCLPFYGLAGRKAYAGMRYALNRARVGYYRDKIEDCKLITYWPARSICISKEFETRIARQD